MAVPSSFPRYLMYISGAGKFLTLAEAGAAYDDGHVLVEIGDLVLLQDFSVREITPKEKELIETTADAFSESK